MSEPQTLPQDSIAVVGLAGRLPKAPDIDAFWRHQVELIEGSRRLSRAELEKSGRTPADLDRQDLVPLAATIEDIDCFDAPFFRYTAAEAEVIDPQIRLLHEVAWATLENAGCKPSAPEQRIGVFASANISSYWLYNLAGRFHGLDPNELLHLVSTNSQDYLATTLAYRLGLTGPALSVQTACSSSLVLTAIACQSLLDGSCDAALAIAASLTLPQASGYISTADSIFSPDGVCRPFDSEANGTYSSDGLCGVLLKRLEDAEAEGDRILAVIRGWALNNDGRRKIGFFAPSAEGQREVLLEAAAAAEVAPGDLEYLEAHGTGTHLGDPIEFEAIRAVHGQAPRPGHELVLSSLKSSIGHLGAAAGLGGLMRSVLALYNRKIPGNLHFKSLNPAISTEGTQLRVLAETADFPDLGRPPRAGVSSFGVGGTNAHMILEAYEAEVPEVQASPRPEVIALSGLDAAGLERQVERLRDWLAAGRVPATERAFPSLAAVSDGLMFDRELLPHRRAVVGSSVAEVLEALERPAGAVRAPDVAKACFVFTGSGVPSLTAARQLAEQVPAFAEAMAELDEILIERGQPRASEWLGRKKAAEAERELRRSHVAAFAFGYAQARMWQSLGLEPGLVLGHSMGEIAAACIAGAISPEAALAFVTERAGIIEESAEPGELLAVAGDEADFSDHLANLPGLALAGRNGVGQSLVAGPSEAIETLRSRLKQAGLPCSLLPAGRPFHSPGMAPTCDKVAAAAEDRFSAAALPLASTVTGRLETEAIASPSYWSAQMVTPVDLTAAIDAALGHGCTLFLELGPRPTFGVGGGRTLIDRGSAADWLSALSPGEEGEAADIAGVLAGTRARLFERGFPTRPLQRPRAGKSSLPGYAFAKLRYWRDEHRDTQGAALSEFARQAGRPSDQAEGRDTPCESSAEDLLQDLLSEIWCLELGRKSFDRRDSFVALGGTSLAALKVVGAVERQLGLRPPVESLILAESFDAFVDSVTALLLQAQEAEAPRQTERLSELQS